jgi:hypothetical protein
MLVVADASPIVAAVAISVFLTILFGAFFPATGELTQRAREGAIGDPQPAVRVTSVR